MKTDMQEQDYYGNSNRLFLKRNEDGNIKIPPRQYCLKTIACLVIGHWWGVDDYKFYRACARCGKTQLNNYGKNWVSHKKWKELNNVKD